MSKFAKFMIMMPWGRVGSNVLMNNVAQISAIKERKFENENLIDIPDEFAQLEWIRKFYGHADGFRLKGSKQNIVSIVNPQSLETMLDEFDIPLIRLRRRNIVKVAVSQLRAELYAEHTLGQTGVALWGVPSDSEPLGPLELDAARFLEILTIAKDADDALLGFEPRTPTFAIEYEDLQNDPEGFAERTCDWLRLPLVRRARSKFVKATPDRLAIAIPNLAELRTSLRASPLSHLEFMFDG